jgi:3-dehydroquinate synthetase
MQLMAQDKKVRHGKLSFVLARGIGKSFLATDVESAEVRAFLTEKLAQS